MNIFLFEFNLDDNAKYFMEKDPLRFNKQILESTQLFAASLKHWYKGEVLKSDGNPYVVDRILHHPACKWLLVDINNHIWHTRYLLSMLKLKPNHSCRKSVEDALNKCGIIKEELPVYPVKEFLRLTNSDMSGLPENAPVTVFYKRHLENKHKESKKAKNDLTK